MQDTVIKMFDTYIAFCLKNRVAVLASAILMSVLGWILVAKMPIDVLPNLNRPMVVIMTEAHAMVAEEVEQLVTLPLEQILNGASGVQRVRSTSAMGLSIVKIEFDWGSDVHLNRQIVMEKLPMAKSRLPKGLEPVMMPISSIMGQIQIIGISSRSGSQSDEDLRALAESQLQYELLSVAGVSKVIIAGGAQKQLQVIIEPENMMALGVSVEDIQSAILNNNSNGSGAPLDLGVQAPVITVKGRLNSIHDLEWAWVKNSNQAPVYLRDVANLQFGPSPIQVGEVGINGKLGVSMIIMKQPDADTVNVTEAIADKIANLQDSLDPDLVFHTDLFKQSDFIHRAINNITESVRDGGLMVCLVLFIFLMNWRLTLITLTVIPLSMAMTTLVFYLMDVSINTMTLGGIAVAIGALVDDAIVDVENVYRRLQQNHRLDPSHQRPWLDVVYEASCEVRKPIVIGTILVILVYLPLYFLTGMEGKLFSPIATAYIVSVLASLFVSLSVTPALGLMLLPSTLDQKGKPDRWLVRQLKRITGYMIDISLNYSKTMVMLLSVGVLVSVFLFMQTGRQFLPAFNEGVAQVNLVLPPETSLKTSSVYGQRLEKLLVNTPGVKNVVRRTGRAEGDEHAEGVNSSEIIVTFDPDADVSSEHTIATIRQSVALHFPGVAFAIDQPLAHLLSAMLSGVQAQVAIKIHGPDLFALRELADEVKKIIQKIYGVKDLMVEPQVLVPHITVTPKRDILANHGLSSDDITHHVELALGGEAISHYVQGRYLYPIMMRLEHNHRDALQDIELLPVYCPDGSWLRLKDVADVEVSKTVSSIKRVDVGRRIVVQHNVENRALSEVIEDVQLALAPVREKLKGMKGFSLELSGAFEAQREATKVISWLSCLVFILMCFVLVIHFKSFNCCCQVMVSIPMAFIGSVCMITWTQQTVSVATLVGLISLGGMAARNAILLIDHALHLMKEHNVPLSKAIILKAGQERMVPVVMTALTSGIALIPLTLAPGQPGKEILYPVATVIIGGLISSTLLEFLVSPALFWLFSGHQLKTKTNSSSE